MWIFLIKDDEGQFYFLQYGNCNTLSERDPVCSQGISLASKQYLFLRFQDKKGGVCSNFRMNDGIKNTPNKIIIISDGSTNQTGCLMFNKRMLKQKAFVYG